MAGENLPGTYESETPGATKRAQELLAAYRKSKKEGTYELTTKESQEIREAIKTAGDVRKLLMREESVADYNQLSPEAKKIVKQAYDEANNTISNLLTDKVIEISKNTNLLTKDYENIGKKLGEKVAGLVEFAKKDFGVVEYPEDDLKIVPKIYTNYITGLGKQDSSIDTTRAKQVVDAYESSLLNKEEEFKKLKKEVEAEAAKTK